MNAIALKCQVLLAAAALVVPAADTKVACVGNSITYGYGLEGLWPLNYPNQLDTLLGPGWSVSNFGVSGKTMIRASNDAWWNQPAFPNALASLPDVVVIELGTNDSKSYIWAAYGKDFANDYKAMVDTFRTLSTKPKVWATLQPWADNASWGIRDSMLTNEINPRIRQVALEQGLGLIDLHAAFAAHPEWMQSDSVHPNGEGARQLARLVHGMLTRPALTISRSGDLLTAPAGFGYRWMRNDTLLADSGATLSVTVPGTYKVSVRVEAASQSRQVSEGLAVASTTGLSVTTAAKVSVRLDAQGAVRVVGASERLLVLRDVRGRKEWRRKALRPGVYSWSVGSVQGKLTVLP